MTRQPTDRPRRLEALLDERDRLRIRLSLADDRSRFDADTASIRLRLIELDRQIFGEWKMP
jgi:hypothetical protein